MQATAAGFLDRYFPRRCELVEHWRAQLVDMPGQPVGLDTYVRTGSVFEIVVGLDLAMVPPYADVLDLLPADERAHVLTTLGYIHDESVDQWCRNTRCEPPVGDDQHVMLDIATRMHLADQLLGKDREATADQQQLLAEQFKNALGLNADERRALTVAWEIYLQHGREALLALGPTRAIQP